MALIFPSIQNFYHQTQKTNNLGFIALLAIYYYSILAT